MTTPKTFAADFETFAKAVEQAEANVREFHEREQAPNWAERFCDSMHSLIDKFEALANKLG